MASCHRDSPRFEPDTTPHFQPLIRPRGGWLAPVAAIRSIQEKSDLDAVSFGDTMSA
jgi:hypothetical protein